MTRRAPSQQCCATCERPLPRRAYRAQCASCIKESNGYVRGPMPHINWLGQTVWYDEWFKADEKLAVSR